MIGHRLRALREEKKLSQGEIERRTGLLRCYISREENGHTVPSIGTLEKVARALDVPLYQIFYDPEGLPPVPKLGVVRTDGEVVWGNSRREARQLAKLRLYLSQIGDFDRQLLLGMTMQIAKARPAKAGAKSLGVRNWASPEQEFAVPQP